MLNLFIFKHKSENYCNMEIAHGVLGNYALVSQIFFISLLCIFCTRHYIDTERRCSVLFFCLKMSIEFDTVTFCIFLYQKLVTEPFSEAHNIDICGAKHIKYVKIYKTGEMLVQNVFVP